MKLAVNDNRDTLCNGITNAADNKKIASASIKATTNGDVHSEDSSSNSDSVNGADTSLLVEDTTCVRNGSEDNSSQNGSKPDDTRSWSSNSSNFPPPDIDEDLSDEMTLRLSDDEEESEVPAKSTENEKDNNQFSTFTSPLLKAESCELADKNLVSNLLTEDKLLKASSANVDTQATSGVDNEVTDKYGDKSGKMDSGEANDVTKKDKDKNGKTEPENEEAIIKNDLDENNEIESLISEIMPEKVIIDISNDNKTVTELREEIEEILKTNDEDDIDNYPSNKLANLSKGEETSMNIEMVDSSKVDTDESCNSKLITNEDSKKTDIPVGNTNIENNDMEVLTNVTNINDINSNKNSVNINTINSNENEMKITDLNDGVNEDIEATFEETPTITAVKDDNSKDNTIEEDNSKVDNFKVETVQEIFSKVDAIPEDNSKVYTIQEKYSRADTIEKDDSKIDAIEEDNSKVDTIEEENCKVDKIDDNSKINTTEDKNNEIDVLNKMETEKLENDNDLETTDKNSKCQNVASEIVKSDKIAENIESEDNVIVNQIIENVDTTKISTESVNEEEKNVANETKINLDNTIIELAKASNREFNTVKNDKTKLITDQLNHDIVEPMETGDKEVVVEKSVFKQVTGTAPDLELMETENIVDYIIIANTSFEINKSISMDTEQMEVVSEDSGIENVNDTISSNIHIPKENIKNKCTAIIQTAENNDGKCNKIEITDDVNAENAADTKLGTLTKFGGKDDIKIEELKGSKTEEGAKSLKRALESKSEDNDAKKPKINQSICNVKPFKPKEYVPANFLRDFMSKNEITTLTRAELEEFCTVKMCECINQTSKVGELNRLIKQQEQVIEMFRNKYNGLKKQIGDLSIVQNKMLQEVRAAKAKDVTFNVMPVKITRSVGLQVCLQPSVRTLRPVPSSPEQMPPAPIVQKRKLQRISLPNKLPSGQTPMTPNTPSKPIPVTIPKPPNSMPMPAKGIKTILPRTQSTSDINKETTTTNSVLGHYLSTPLAGKPTPVTPVRKNIPIVPTPAPTTPIATATANANKVIDLTDEDDVAKTAATTPATATTLRVVAPHQINSSTANVVTSQMQRVTYLVSPGPGQQGQQVLLATTTAPTRPGVPRPTIMLKSVPPGQVAPGQRLNFVRPNGTGSTVAVLPTTTTTTIRPGQQIRFQTAGTTTVPANRNQIVTSRTTAIRHPAPLPGPPAVQPSQPSWKAMPPRPSLKISRVGDGIVLSWKMLHKDMSLYEDIASYQLYAYQETSSAPSTEMWRKVGDVKALALPMACTLTQFTDGNKYHFAVRAVDVKSRVGPFSQPEQIALP